jgi:hypothetical protein
MKRIMKRRRRRRSMRIRKRMEAIVIVERKVAKVKM